VIGGDLAPRAAFSLARRAFGAWRNPSERAVPTAPVSVATAPRFIVIDKPDAGAAIVAAAFRTVARSAADYPAGAVANAVLTGYSGRLNSEVRIKRGLAYGAYAALNAYATDGILVAQTASVENPKIPEATAVVSATLRDFAAATVGPDELSARRLAALGERSYQLQRERGVVALLATNARYGLAPTAVAAEAAAERSITPAEVHAFARRYLERATIVVIGKAAAFLPALRAAHPDLEVVPFARLDLDSPRLRAPTLGG
jgi:zinc protease